MEPRPGKGSFERQAFLDGAISDLQRPQQGPVDVENGLYSLAIIGDLTVGEAGQILRAASSSVSEWVSSTEDTDLVLSALIPSLETYGKYVAQQSDPRAAADFLEISSQIVSGMVVGNPSDDMTGLREAIKAGVFGNPGNVLLESLKKLFATYGDNRSPDGEDQSHDINLAAMTIDLIETGDKKLMEELKTSVPVEFVFADTDIRYYFPDAWKFLQTIEFSNEEKTRLLAERLVDYKMSRSDGLAVSISGGEFGDPIVVAYDLIRFLYSDENTTDVKPEIRDIAAEDLWIELLERDRNDERLIPIREILANQGWYWLVNDDLVYVAVDTLNGLKIPVGEEESFVRAHLGLMLRAFMEHNDYLPQNNNFYQELIHNPESFVTRFTNILKELRISKNKEEYENYPDDRLIADLNK